MRHRPRAIIRSHWPSARGLSGEDQKACKAQADTAYQTAQALARQAKADSDPKP